MDKDSYHSGTDRLTSSGAKEILKSPAHYMLRYGPRAKRPAPSAAMRFGTAVHMLILEGEEKFKQHVACRPDGLNLRTKAGKAEMEAFIQASGIDAGMIFSQSDYDDMFWMRDAVWQHPVCAEILTDGYPEHYYQWEDAGTGAPCKALVDWTNDHCIVDLKTCQDASPDGFCKAVYNFKYHLSAMFYMMGDAQIHRSEIGWKNWYWFAVEKHTHQVAVYTMDETMMRIGLRQCKQAMKTYQICRASNDWHSYPRVATELISPSWAK